MAAALVFYLNASAVVSKARRSTRTIGAESVPSIAAASEIRVALSDAIASAAVGSLATGSPAREAWDRYDKAMSIAGEHLVAAAANIKAEHRDEDQQPILTIVSGDAARHGADCARARNRRTRWHGQNSRSRGRRRTRDAARGPMRWNR